MLELWFVGFLWSFLLAVSVLFLLKKREFVSKVDFIVSVILSIFVGWIYTVGAYVPINLSVYSFWIYSILLVVIFAVLFLFTTNNDSAIKKREFVILCGVVVLIMFMLFITTSAIFRPAKVSSLVKFKDANESLFEKIEPQRVRLIPKETAIMLAEKTLGSYRKHGIVLGSQLQIDKEHTTIQKINGSLYWVVPLGYKGMFKQFSFGDIPGYILVDAYDSTKPAILKDGYKIKYSLQAYFERWAKRKLWLDNITDVLSDFSFEVNDNFQPYIVATVLKPKVGFGKFMPVGVKILNVQTGEIKYYPLNKIPSWVDRVMPEDIIANRINEKGNWHNGIVSALFTGNGTWQLTNYNGSSEMFFVEDGSGKTYWVSGVTSTGKDDSIIALVAVNTRTGKSYWISINGPTEKAVKNIVESSLGVNKSVWKTELPILYNIYGKLVWVTVVVDKHRAYPIKYAIVDSKNITHYVVKKDFNSALTEFFQNIPIPDIKKEIFIYAGHVNRFNVSSGYLYFWASNHVWQCSIKKYPICAVIEKNDTVHVMGVKKGKVVWLQKIKDYSIKAK